MKKRVIMAVLAGALSAAGAQEQQVVLSAIESATGWTAEELARGLEMLDRIYSNDCTTANGRIRWHGPVMRTEYRTNELMKVAYHEDGYVHTEKFRPIVPRPVDERLSESARKAAAAQRDREQKEARLEYLLTHADEEIDRLSKDYPRELAALIYTNSVNKARSAVAEFHPITTIVTPGS